MSNYLIAVGEKDYSRAASLNLIFDNHSVNFFPKVGPESKLLFAGCGNGKLVIEIAKLYKETLGVKIVAFDMSEEQLKCARAAALEEGVSNIEWMQLDIHDLSQFQGKFDIVHARFILNHLHDAKQVTKALCTTLVQGGTFVGEELGGYEMTVTSDKPEHTEAIRAWEQGVILQHAKQRSNIAFAKKMPKILEKAGMKITSQEQVGPVASTPEQKNLFPASMRNGNRILAPVFHPVIEVLQKQLEAVRDSDCAITFKHFTQIQAIKL